MKWIGRILYILFVLIVIGFVELIAGGTEGIRVSEYVHNNVTQYAKDNPDYDIFDGLAHLNAVSKTYYSKDSIHTLDGQTHYDTTGESIADEYKIKIGMYPHTVVHKNPQFNLYSDGVFILIEDYSDEVAYYKLEVTGYYANDPEKKQIVLKDQSFLNIYTDVVDANMARGSFKVALIANNTFANSILQSDNDFKFPDDYNFEYHIQAIDVHAVFVDPDKPDTPETVHIYRMTDGTTFASGNPEVLHENLNLSPDTYNFSKHMNGQLPTEDNNPYNLVLDYHPVDLSPYNFAYWIVYGIYFLLFIVVPYFWFIHKPLMRTIRKKKDDDDLNNPDRKPLPQIFSDVEPKSEE